MKKIQILVSEIQRNEKLKSVRQVFERYPYLGELYYKELQGNEVTPAEVKEALKDTKKLLLD